MGGFRDKAPCILKFLKIREPIEIMHRNSLSNIFSTHPNNFSSTTFQSSVFVFSFDILLTGQHVVIVCAKKLPIGINRASSLTVMQSCIAK